jgi:hypothetical protein
MSPSPLASSTRTPPAAQISVELVANQRGDNHDGRVAVCVAVGVSVGLGVIVALAVAVSVAVALAVSVSVAVCALAAAAQTATRRMAVSAVFLSSRGRIEMDRPAGARPAPYRGGARFTTEERMSAGGRARGRNDQAAEPTGGGARTAASSLPDLPAVDRDEYGSGVDQRRKEAA